MFPDDQPALARSVPLGVCAAELNGLPTGNPVVLTKLAVCVKLSSLTNCTIEPTETVSGFGLYPATVPNVDGEGPYLSRLTWTMMAPVIGERERLLGVVAAPGVQAELPAAIATIRAMRAAGRRRILPMLCDAPEPSVKAGKRRRRSRHASSESGDAVRGDRRGCRPRAHDG